MQKNFNWRYVDVEKFTKKLDIKARILGFESHREVLKEYGINIRVILLGIDKFKSYCTENNLPYKEGISMLTASNFFMLAGVFKIDASEFDLSEEFVFNDWTPEIKRPEPSTDVEYYAEINRKLDIIIDMLKEKKL